MLKPMAGAVVLLASVSLPAFGDHPERQPQPLGVWDSQGKFVGDFVGNGNGPGGEGQVVIEVNKTPTLFQFEYSGLTKAGPSIFYQGADCVGEGYLDVRHPPTMGIWLGEGEEVYYPGRPALVDGIVSARLILLRIDWMRQMRRSPTTAGLLLIKVLLIDRAQLRHIN
jgi:hypothetical protein